MAEISRLLTSLCSWAGRFESYLVENPEDRFSRDGAHLIHSFLQSEQNSYVLRTSLEILMFSLNSYKNYRQWTICLLKYFSIYTCCQLSLDEPF